MGRFPLVRILDFIAKVFPFDTLEREELNGVVAHMELAYYPRGQVIIRAGGDPAENLYIIHSGSIRVTVPSEAGEEFLVDMRGEGDLFGAVSLLQSRKALFTVTAQEDLLTFLLPADEFRRLVAEHSVFERHFSLSLARNIRAVWDTSQSHPGHRPGVESLKAIGSQMRRRAADLMSREVLTCDPETSIRQAAVAMTRREVGSIVVVNGSESPVGLVTDTDLRSRVLAEGLSPDTPVKAIMSQPPLRVGPQAFAFEAVLEMTRRGVHHLLVTEAGRMLGVISDHDIKVVTGGTPVGLAREIDKAGTLEDLDRLPERIRRVLELLVNLGSSADYMMDLLSEFLDRLYGKIFELCEAQMVREGLGGAPAGFTWLVLGRAGRKEQAPPVRQDSALVYADVPSDQEGVVREWFIGFSRRVNEALRRWHFALGPGARQTGGAEWCRSASAWRRTYREWVLGQAGLPTEDPGAVFDFRAIGDDGGFTASLRDVLGAAMVEDPGFLPRLAGLGTAKRPPIGFLRDFVVEKDGGYTERLDLDGQGLRLLAGAVRVMALDGNLAVTNTLARLRRAAGAWNLDKRLEDDLHEAFSFMTVLWVSRYLDATGAGEREDVSTLNPAGLSTMQRKMMKESFGVIAQLQDVLARRFAGGATGGSR